MLVECPHCEISFNPEMGVCPRCRTFRPHLPECDDFVRSRVRSDIESGYVNVDDLLRRLQEKGLASGKAVEIVEEERRRYQQGVRLRARQRIVIGILLLFFGPIFFLGGCFAPQQAALGKGPGAAMGIGVMCVFVGCAFLGFGVLRLVRGRD
jgi:hypothetical protein